MECREGILIYSLQMSIVGVRFYWKPVLSVTVNADLPDLREKSSPKRNTAGRVDMSEKRKRIACRIRYVLPVLERKLLQQQCFMKKK